MDTMNKEKELNEKKLHVLYYVPGKNMRGLNMIMRQLQNLWGRNVVALPKDLTKLAKNEMSLNDLIALRNMLNSIIIPKQRELGLIPPAPPNKAPISAQHNPNMPHRPKNGPATPPAPPTSGSNAVKPTPQQPQANINRINKRGFIKQDFEAPPIPTKIDKKVVD